VILPKPSPKNQKLAYLTKRCNNPAFLSGTRA
jgi:hypothetical protein